MHDTMSKSSAKKWCTLHINLYIVWNFQSKRRSRPLPDPPSSAQKEVLSGKATNEHGSTRQTGGNRRRKSDPVNPRLINREYVFYWNRGFYSRLILQSLIF